MRIFETLIFILLPLFSALVSAGRSFSIDYDNKTFLRNGAAHRYVSGTLHYFRVLPGAWRDRLDKMRLAGQEFIRTQRLIFKKNHI